MRRLLVPFLAALLAAQAVVAEATPARACALDQRPSLSTNGRLVVLNKQVARTQAELAIWAFFVVPGVYRTGQSVTMTENRKEVANTLMPSARLQPWGWTFGDGSFSQGWTIRHAYTHPGHWKIGVYAYNPESRRWDLFDQATITIGR
ncbi:MAG TPA: hypothetical protein VNL35_12240 [Chloroflexota bacterium]|nr:hypothetical protein [Chloroflexota bacterium]